MKQAFGHDFVLVNDTRQFLNQQIFKGGPWVHLATVKRGLKEYCAFQRLGSRKVYIEEVDPRDPHLFRKIGDDTEWADLYRFLVDAGCLIISGLGHELKGDKNGIPGLITTNGK